MLWIALAILALACGGAADDSGSDGSAGSPADTESTTEPVLALAPDTTARKFADPTCGMTLRVSTEWLPMAKRQGARWGTATGCPVTFSDAGVPVTFEPGLLDNEVWGETIVHTINGHFAWCNSVRISLESRDIEQTLSHELGHCMGAVGGIDGGGHTTDGIMKAWHRPEDDSHIDAAALGLVCASVPCLKFVPESLDNEQEPK